MKWIGIDVAKRSFTVAQKRGSCVETKSFPMSPAGFRAFRRWAPRSPHQVCLESTGPYWLALAQWLEQAGITYGLANPRKVRRFAEASEHASKTDPIDAQLLLRFAETFPLVPVAAASGPWRELRCLSRRILQLQTELTRDRDRREKALANPATPKAVRDSHTRVLEALGQLIKELECQARACILRHRTMNPTFRLLVSIPGIGPKTARTLLAEYGPRLLSASPKQMTRYAGLDIVLWQSGTSVNRRPRISKTGNWRLRRALYLAALAAARSHSPLADFYQRQRQAGLMPKQALVALMRKLLHLCHGVLKHQTPYQGHTSSA